MSTITRKVNQFLESEKVKALSNTTQNNYRYALGHLREFCREYGWKLNTLKNARDPFLDFLKKKEISGHSIQQYGTIVKIFARWAGYPLAWEPFRISSQERKANKRKQLRRWFDENDVAKCKEYKFPRHQQKAPVYRIVTRLLAETGARVREIAHVEAKHIDLEECTVWLMDSKTEPRPAFFSPKTRDLIIQLKKSKTFWEGEMFPDTEQIKKVVAEMLEDLDLRRPGRGPHTFRHYVATRLFYEGNMRIDDISVLLGTTVEIIVKNYLHPTPDMLKRRVFKAMQWHDPWDKI